MGYEVLFACDAKPGTPLVPAITSADIIAHDPLQRNGRTDHIFGQIYEDADGSWTNTGMFRVCDLPAARLVVEKAYEYLMSKLSVEMEGDLHGLNSN